MRKQTLKDRMDEHLGSAHRGRHKQSMKARRHESEGMEKHYGHSESHAIGDHRHHKKMHDHHMKEAKKHMTHMHKMACRKKK